MKLEVIEEKLNDGSVIRHVSIVKEKPFKVPKVERALSDLKVLGDAVKGYPTIRYSIIDIIKILEEAE